MAGALILVSAPPKGTPFLDALGRVTSPWLSWLASITTASAILKSSVADVADSSLQAANNLSDLANLGTARVNLGLGTAATQNATAFDAAGAATAAQAAAIAASDPAGAATAAKAAAMAASDPAGTAAAAFAALLAASSVFTGALNTFQGIAGAVRTLSANTTALLSDRLLVLTGAAALTVSLPATPATGHELLLCNASVAATISGNGASIWSAGTSATTYSLAANATAILIYDGTLWRVVKS